MIASKTLFCIVVIAAVGLAQNVGNIQHGVQSQPSAVVNKPSAKAAVASAAAPQPVVLGVGARQPGDALVGSADANPTFPTPQDVSDTLNYPQTGTGANITFIQVTITSDSATDPNVFLTQGGVGQRTAQIVIQSKQVTQWTMSTRIYGTP